MFILSARSQIKPQPKHQVPDVKKKMYIYWIKIKLVFWRLKSRLKSKKDRKLRPLMSNQPLMKRKFINFPMAGLRSSFSKKSTKYAWKNQTRYPSSILWSIKKEISFNSWPLITFSDYINEKHCYSFCHTAVHWTSLELDWLTSLTLLLSRHKKI